MMWMEELPNIVIIMNIQQNIREFVLMFENKDQIRNVVFIIMRYQ